MSERLTLGGHATVVLDVGGRRIVTDPVLRGHVQGVIRTRQGLSADELGTVDAVLISHLHHDHLDLASLRRIGKRTPIVCAAGAETMLERRGFSDVTPLRRGERTTAAGVTVRAVEANHDAARALSRASADPVGFVIEAASNIYFAGDTDLFDDMERIGRGIDVALVPIWGWGPTLGDGHLNPESAAVAVRMLAPRLVIPIHWGSFSPVGSRLLWSRMLEQPVVRFLAAMAEQAPEIEVRVLRPGDSIDLEAVTA